MNCDIWINLLKEKAKDGKITENNLYELAEDRSLTVSQLSYICDNLEKYNLKVVSDNDYNSEKSQCENLNTDNYSEIECLFQNLNYSQKCECINRLQKLMIECESEESASIKSNFYKKIKSMNLQYSYIAVTLKAFFASVDKRGYVCTDDLVKYFRKFYIDRINGNLISEQSDSIFATRDFSDAEIRRNLYFNPLGRSFLVNSHFFICDKKTDIVKINRELWDSLTQQDINEIIGIVDEKLNLYYSKL